MQRFQTFKISKNNETMIQAEEIIGKRILAKTSKH